MFQSLRVYVNNELGNLRDLLSRMDLLFHRKTLGVIITFHSLETRIVQDFFSKNAIFYRVYADALPVSQEELQLNPASRSGKLFLFTTKSGN